VHLDLERQTARRRDNAIGGPAPLDEMLDQAGFASLSSTPHRDNSPTTGGNDLLKGIFQQVELRTPSYERI
jgi:hypothetical protein